jgi:hypothetical protein
MRKRDDVVPSLLAVGVLATARTVGAAPAEFQIDFVDSLPVPSACHQR